MNMKNKLFTALAAALLSSCGYHLNGVKPDVMQGKETYCVEMFDNATTSPNVAVQLTSALGDAMQRDSTYRPARRGEADFTISGQVKNINRTSLMTDYEDAYHSLEVGVSVDVAYTVTDRRTGKVLIQSVATGQSSYFNDLGNVQTALDSALSYATRRAAEEIVNTVANK